jgi:hypothetical protein
MLVSDSGASETILAIHHYSDQAVSTLNTKAEVLSVLRDKEPGYPVEDFNTASDGPPPLVLLLQDCSQGDLHCCPECCCRRL